MCECVRARVVAWSIVLKEGRAGYDKEIVATLSPQLTRRFRCGFNRPSLYRMIKFSLAFPDVEIVASLGPQLSWSHFREVIAVGSAEARAFYIDEAIARPLSVRELRPAISHKAQPARFLSSRQLRERIRVTTKSEGSADEEHGKIEV
ncbi:MAG TPA: DUF1016 N-terminal domain-containing protein [Arachnia sp.]|nr:DUF1016 N-terminal domain-containing protein [Arachnia sp.]